MTPAQIQTFSTAIAAETDATVVAALAAGNNNALLSWYNSDASPEENVWRTSVSVDQTIEAIDWTEFMGVPVEGGDDIAGIKAATEQGTEYARQNLALTMLLSNGEFNPSLQTVRDALAAIFAGDANTRAAILAIAKRAATNVESVFFTGAVQGAQVMGYEGPCTLQNIRDAVAMIS